MPSRKTSETTFQTENDLPLDSRNGHSHAKTFSPPVDKVNDVPINEEENVIEFQSPPSFWRLVKLSSAEWLYALLGSIGAAIFGSFNPLLAYMFALIVTTYYRDSDPNRLREEVNKWCLLIPCMGIVTLVANFLQHFYFGIMGEKMVERVRRMMFSGDNFFLNQASSLDIELTFCKFAIRIKAKRV